ncbi:MerR family transcriptional regulator [Marinimicrobium sp. ABcell2]|uniref:MerR family transcriptional regulator n=1 Tax=Marinimicrobium sp. ABcell2 TaxID=3069751 RepID=UPI0027B463BA|nr:MerR family transcriptional regulator [Marinimicrobium sp. ABcell2]MDQ2077853.1 MerR family transcriptional regulator [Marinimicrobium sp. ABcell2]
MNVELDQGDHSAVPIREVARQTGINPVTLRAWERRYGLLKPLRTAKGHRLYRPEDIQRVQEIQRWLSRGLAVSQVKGLLENGEESGGVIQEGLWSTFIKPLMKAVDTLNQARFDQLLEEVTALYPVGLIVDRLLAPLQEHLAASTRYGAETRAAFFEAGVHAHFSSAIYRQRKNTQGPKILVVQLPGSGNSVLPRVLTYELMTKSYRANFFGALAETEWVFALEQTKSRAMIIYADEARDSAGLARLRSFWERRANMPVFLAGRMTALFKADVGPSKNRLLGESHSEIQANVNQLDRALSSQGGVV